MSLIIFRHGWIIAIALALLSVSAPGAKAASPGRVNVILWFDTEDYLLPADDDACKRLADMLTARGIRATFKVVGEKARVLEQRGRQDVIDALKKHDIAYHANFHSVHPTPAEYMADCGLLDGIAEFVRREGPGAADVRRVFGVESLSCYGQPGSSWASQAVAALKQIGVTSHGIPCYVDEGDHVGLNGQPFWFAGALVVYHMAPNYTRMELHDPAAVDPAKQEVSQIADRLRSQRGLISIFYHPCEWVHREFWDGVNFRRGSNPPREQWKAPPQRTTAETDGAFQRFGEYIDHIRSIPDVRFVTARDLPEVYPDLTRTAGAATEQDLDTIAKGLSDAGGPGADFVVLGQRAFSLADQFELLTMAVSAYAQGKPSAFPLATTGLLGPDSPPPGETGAREIPWTAFRDATRDVLNYLQVEHRIPARVFVGPDAIAPSAYLASLAAVYLSQRNDGKSGEAIKIGRALKLLPQNHVAADSPGLFGGWIIHKEDFRAPRILDVARLQAWTLKPALPTSDR